MYFRYKDLTFELTSPEYETKNFGGKMGELRVITLPYTPSQTLGYICTELDDLPNRLVRDGYLACTFRGKEDTQLVRYLDTLGFKFVGTYRMFSCYNKDFMSYSIPPNNLEVVFAHEDDYSRILEIESQVFDYSTFQIDDRFPADVTAKRNVQRVKSYFNNPNHVCYVVKSKGFVIGFNQFIVDYEARCAENVNSAVDPNSQNRYVGTKLYLESFRNVLSVYDMVTGGVCTQNPRPTRILNTMGFKFIDQEIHLRLKL